MTDETKRRIEAAANREADRGVPSRGQHVLERYYEVRDSFIEGAHYERKHARVEMLGEVRRWLEQTNWIENEIVADFLDQFAADIAASKEDA